MSGRASVDEALTAEEEKAIVAKLAVLLPALGLVACVPRLPIKRSFRDNDVYAPEHESGTSLAEHIMNELLGTINETRERQGRPLDKQLSSHTSLKRPLQALVTACGEDKPEAFNRLANSLGVVVPTVRHTRRNSVLQGQENTPPSKRSKPNDPAPEFAPSDSNGCSFLAPPPSDDLAVTRTGQRAIEEAAAAALRCAPLASSLATSRSDDLEVLGGLLSPEVMMSLVRGHLTAAAGARGVSALPSLLAEALPVRHRAALASPLIADPPTRRLLMAPDRTSEGGTAPSRDVVITRAGVLDLERDEVLALLDDLSRQLFGREGQPASDRDTALLRRCVLAVERINAYLSRDGVQCANFVRSILETYGADEGPRLPLGTFLTSFFFATSRIADNDHWGCNLSGLRFDRAFAGSDIFIETLKDLKFLAGNSALQFLRGPVCSNVLSRGLARKGYFYLDSMSEEEKRDRLGMFGPGIPSVRTLNRSPEDERIDRGGMSAPLASTSVKV